jgi:hypothetical protein
VYDPRGMEPIVRPRTSVLAAWSDGWRRVIGAPWVLVGLAVASFLTSRVAWPAWPATWLQWVFENDVLSFGGSTNTIYQASTMQPLRILAFGRFVDFFLAVNLGVVVMLFLTGGAIDRLARMRPVGAAAFFGATGDAFLRFLRASVVLGALTWLWLDVVVPQTIALTPPLTDTTSWLQPRAVVLVAGLVGLVILGIIGDYSRVRIVVEDRRSVLGAIGAGCRFVWRRPLAVLALTSLNLIVAAMVTFLATSTFAALAGAIDETPTMVAIRGTAALTVFALLQAALRLGCIGAAVSYFQSELAHAGYTARPTRTWPDSPAVEAIANLEAQARAAGSETSFRL